MANNHDELQRRIKQDELEDQLAMAAEGDLVKMTVGDFAKARGMSPQLVHYYIRNKKISSEHCICGRKVIDVKAAKEFFDAKDNKNTADE